MEVDAGAIDVHPAVGAFERRAVVGDAAVALLPFVGVGPDVALRRISVGPVGCALEAHRDPAAELHIDVPRCGRIARALGMECSPAFQFHRPAEQIAATPDGDVHRMNAPAGDEAERVLRYVPPRLRGSLCLAKVLRVRPEGRRAEPHVVIQPCGHRDDLG